MKQSAKAGQSKKNLKGEKTGEKHKEDQYAVEGFFYSLDQVAKCVVNKLDVEASDLKELLEAYNELIDSLEEYMQLTYESSEDV